ncbi:InlB B-repeat-containing protein [Methanimicrococcus sp. OttesenSCG-928-J09]|nr:InlB B-repeat-containing protein [Methanimicrococcus sp. OttesenSCG-928-J09]
MKKGVKTIFLSLVAVLFFTATLGTATAVDFKGGEGTSENPYQIETAVQLNGIRDNLSAHYVLKTDINMKGTAYELNWVPIGNTTHPFTGTFDGGNFKIQNLKCIYNQSDDIRGKGVRWDVGLFGSVQSPKSSSPNSSRISNLVLENVDILVGHNNNNNQENIAGLVGYLKNGTVENCHVSGKINGTKFVGGVVGKSVDSTIKSCSFKGPIDSVHGWTGGITGSAAGDIIDCQVNNSNITSKGSKVGGITGQLSGNMIGCSATYIQKLEGGGSNHDSVGGLVGLVNGPSLIKESNSGADVGKLNSWNLENEIENVGGLVGSATGTVEISNSFSLGTATGSKYVGGLIGLSGEGSTVTIKNSYSFSGIYGADSSGGLVGKMFSGDIINCFSASDVKAKTSNAGGIVGQTVNVNITNCFATGNVSSDQNSAGIVGYAANGKTNLTNCYALNENVIGTLAVNRIVGKMHDSAALNVKKCFAWENMTGETYSESDLRFYGTNLTSDEIWDTFPDKKWAGWSTTVWAANDWYEFRLPVPVWTDKKIQVRAIYLMPAVVLKYDGNGCTSGDSTVPIDNKVFEKPGEPDYPQRATVRGPDDMKKDGYVFEKWTTEADGSGYSYLPGDEILMKKDVTLYAQWTKEEKKGGETPSGGTGEAGIGNPKPVKPAENVPGFENEIIIEEPIVPVTFKTILVLLFFLLAVAVYLFVKRRGDEED